MPNLHPPQHEQTPADRLRAGTLGPRPSPAPIVHETSALGRVQSEPRRALDRLIRVCYYVARQKGPLMQAAYLCCCREWVYGRRS